jgi:PHD/YefM family antitoxin component YafN of YafNO toxin-antitoxin module
MNVVIWFRKKSRRVIRLFSHTGNNLIHYSSDQLESEVAIMVKHEKPVWIKRDGVDVAVVISPELFEELVSAQEELEDIAAVDAAMKDNSPGIPWEQVKKRLARKNKAVTVDIDEL